MNSNLSSGNANHYEGNGWSRYQIMVLQQLDDHNKILQNLNKELVDLKQNIAVTDTEIRIWRAQMMKTVESSEEEISDILYGGNGLSRRIQDVERLLETERHANTKFKATWAAYGAVVSFIITTILHVVNLFFSK
jgi:hypothetical protein